MTWKEFSLWYVVPPSMKGWPWQADYWLSLLQVLGWAYRLALPFAAAVALVKWW